MSHIGRRCGRFFRVGHAQPPGLWGVGPCFMQQGILVLWLSDIGDNIVESGDNSKHYTTLYYSTESVQLSTSEAPETSVAIRAGDVFPCLVCPNSDNLEGTRLAWGASLSDRSVAAEWSCDLAAWPEVPSFILGSSILCLVMIEWIEWYSSEALLRVEVKHFRFTSFYCCTSLLVAKAERGHSVATFAFLYCIINTYGAMPLKFISNLK